jgi:hypothetical protein
MAGSGTVTIPSVPQRWDPLSRTARPGTTIVRSGIATDQPCNTDHPIEPREGLA